MTSEMILDSSVSVIINGIVVNKCIVCCDGSAAEDELVFLPSFTVEVLISSSLFCLLGGGDDASPCGNVNVGEIIISCVAGCDEVAGCSACFLWCGLLDLSLALRASRSE